MADTVDSGGNPYIPMPEWYPDYVQAQGGVDAGRSRWIKLTDDQKRKVIKQYEEEQTAKGQAKDRRAGLEGEQAKKDQEEADTAAYDQDDYGNMGGGDPNATPEEDIGPVPEDEGPDEELDDDGIPYSAPQLGLSQEERCFNMGLIK